MDFLQPLIADAGFFTRAEALACGYDDRDLQRLVRHRILHRIRHGAYTTVAYWSALDQEGRHRLRSDCVLRSLGSVVCLSHVSAAVAHGVPIWGLPLDQVHVTRLDGGAGRVEGDVVHHEGLCLGDDTAEVSGRLVTVADRCAIEAASLGGPEAALALLDSFLRERLVTDEQLSQRFIAMQHWPRMRHLHIPLRLADGRSGSIGETRGNWLFWAAGLPAPILQFEVRSADGELIGITDWAWPDRGVLGEFDGQAKYGRLPEARAGPGRRGLRREAAGGRPEGGDRDEDGAAGLDRLPGAPGHGRPDGDRAWRLARAGHPPPISLTFSQGQGQGRGWAEAGGPG